MNEKNRKLIGYALLTLALVVLLASKNEIKNPPRNYAWRIHVQTGRILAEEFGFEFPEGEFDRISSPRRSILVGENEWKITGMRLVDGTLTPWTALVRYEPGSTSATLIQLNQDGGTIFPTATRSNLVFETNHSLSP